MEPVQTLLPRLGSTVDSNDSVDLVLLTGDCASDLETAEDRAAPGGIIAVVNGDTRSLRTLSSRGRNLISLSLVSEGIAEISFDDPLPGLADKLRGWLAAWDVTPIVVAEKTGSLIQTFRVAWWDEAVRLVADGVPIDLVDSAAKAMGTSVGPLEMLDGLGLETAATQVPRVKPLLAAGIRGRPHGEGFYVLADDHPTCANAVAQLVLLEATAGPHSLSRLQAEIDPHAARSFIQERLTARLTVTAADLLAKDGFVGPVEIDLAIVRGLNLFAAEGGVLRRADGIGLKTVAENLRTLRSEHGDRFKPPAELTRRALARETFHDESTTRTAPLRMSA